MDFNIFGKVCCEHKGDGAHASAVGAAANVSGFGVERGDCIGREPLEALEFGNAKVPTRTNAFAIVEEEGRRASERRRRCMYAVTSILHVCTTCDAVHTRALMPWLLAPGVASPYATIDEVFDVNVRNII
jgi:hypothetical protein